jgi:hypothetical protein
MPTEIQGGVSLARALKEYTPDLAKKTKKELGNILQPMTTKARGYMPANGQMLSGWTKSSSSTETTNYRHFPKYDATTAKRGVNYSVSPSQPNKSGFVSLARIVNASAGGAIYETAGRKSGANGQPTQASTRGKYSDYIDTSNKVNKSLNPNAGKQFIARANSIGALVNAKPRLAGQSGRTTRKMTGRVIYRAFAEDQGKTTARIIKALEAAKVNFYNTSKKVR